MTVFQYCILGYKALTYLYHEVHLDNCCLNHILYPMAAVVWTPNCILFFLVLHVLNYLNNDKVAQKVLDQAGRMKKQSKERTQLGIAI